MSATGLWQATARFDPFESLACACDLLKDAFDTGCPHEGRWGCVPRGEERIDAALQIAHAAEDAAAHGLLAEFGEPAFDQVEPARTGRDEVQHEPRVPRQPAPDARVAVGAVVVEDQVQGFPVGKLGVEFAQELEELLMAVVLVALADHSTFDHLERGEQRGGAVPNVVMGEGAAAAGFER